VSKSIELFISLSTKTVQVYDQHVIRLKPVCSACSIESWSFNATSE